jgi:hypothetical protein
MLIKHGKMCNARHHQPNLISAFKVNADEGVLASVVMAEVI